jgi:predicted Zn-dependent protease
MKNFKRKTVPVTILSILLSTYMSSAPSNSALAQDDVIFKAMKDEMDRSMKELKIKGHEAPYFISYTVKDKDLVRIAGSFGAIDTKNIEHDRDLNVELRVGDYDLDNTRFSDGGLFGMLMGGRLSHGEEITVDDDYKVLRQSIWSETDDAYKGAIEKLEAKKAFLQQNNVKDRPADFSKEKSTTLFESPVRVQCDEAKWSNIVRQLSAVYKDYPKIDQSFVMFGLDTLNRWFVNSEGTKTFSARPEYVLMVTASARADDGTVVCDSEVFVGRTEEDLPSVAEMEKKLRAMGNRLTDSIKAPLLEDYEGPILFENEAAGDFFSQTIGQNFGNPTEPLGGGIAAMMGSTNPLKEKVGQRVLPTFMSVIDDPAATEFKGTKLFGGMNIDHEGVKPQKLTLIDKGILKTFCSTRTPSRYVKESNGHSRYGNATTTNLFVTSETTLSKDDLYKKLRELGKQEGLKSVLVVRRVQNLFTSVLDPKSIIMGMMGSMRKHAGFNLLPASLVYQVDVETGAETLARITPFNGVGLNTLRDIVAVGDNATAYPILLPTASQGDALSIVAPSVLVKEMDTQKADKNTEKAPILPNPYFEQKAAK